MILHDVFIASHGCLLRDDPAAMVVLLSETSFANPVSVCKVAVFDIFMQTVLTIAGFDPSSGAGVTADLMVFAAHGLFGVSCITALTVQSTTGVAATQAVDAEVVRSTLDCLRADFSVAGIKIGMLSTALNVAAVVDFVIELRGLQTQGQRVPVVLDPVLRSSSGRELLDADGVRLLRERLLPLVDWVTPNLDELGVLTERSVVCRDDVAGAAAALQSLGSNLNVLATGGHLNPPDDLVLRADGELRWLAGEEIVSRSTHGTGCALSSALLSRIVLCDDAIAASVAAKSYVAKAIRRATPLGHGHGPINHLWPLRG
jgi:hydroxymethylpyrimidine/phosphomethylpyrimidine kinase